VSALSQSLDVLIASKVSVLGTSVLLWLGFCLGLVQIAGTVVRAIVFLSVLVTRELDSIRKQ
jgi:hypothetical protein